METWQEKMIKYHAKDFKKKPLEEITQLKTENKKLRIRIKELEKFNAELIHEIDDCDGDCQYHYEDDE